MKSPTLFDILGPKLKVIFCGLNPGLSSATHGHHFVNKSNRFWKVLHLAGFTDEMLIPENDRDLLKYKIGLTSAVARATVKASDLSKGDFKKEMKILEKKILKSRPLVIAFLGKAAYKEIFGKKDLNWGQQEELFGKAKVWVLPNTSGLNRNFTLDELVKHYKQLFKEIV